MSTVAEESRFEAWGQINLRLKPEQETQNNTVHFELYSILAVTSTAETKTKIVEVKVCIPMAEDILATQIQEMQKKTTLLQDVQRCRLQHLLHSGRQFRQQC